MGSSHNGNSKRRRWRFFKQFVAHPKEVGAFAASSKYLGEHVAEAAGVPKAEVVVEYGAGTGTITEVVHQKLRNEATFIALEINPEFAQIFRKRFPNIELTEGSVENVRQYLEERGKNGCDSIVSGLPWAAFDGEFQDRLLDVTLEALCPGGKFATYMYISSLVLPAGRRFRKKLQERFTKIGRTQVCWRNLPPAIVFWGEK
jgi:phosphatidylethanolamine/phosphatidyl-N-methylethanolamine N-methyltransferase